jgi:phosphomevalonate kinase
MTRTRISAPGKVLLAGGYLVLDRPNVGLVIAADKRFHSTVEFDPSLPEGTIMVNSPQFHSSWKYCYQNEELVPSLENSSMNDFVEKTLRVCLLYLQPKEPPKLSITIQADNEFYSLVPHLKEALLERTPEAVQSLGNFLPCPKDDKGKPIVNKTGLGSSAALVTSLVGAILHFYPKSSECDDEDIDTSEMIHNLAQICHCYAQGKVGSGFDVSAACHGTHVYRRFPKCLLPDLLHQLEVLESHSKNVKLALQRLVEMTPWAEDLVEGPRLLPQPLQILMGDVCGGSESPGMARAVLKWKQEVHMKDPTTPIPHWDDLKVLNESVVELFQQLSFSETNTNSSDEYDQMATQLASEWPSTSILSELNKTFTKIRQHLKKMGEAANIPIEPDQQTSLCDTTCQIPGVVTALVPGAGGYDAIACLYIDRPGVLESIGALWATYKDPITICPLGLQASDFGLRLEEP